MANERKIKTASSHGYMIAKYADACINENFKAIRQTRR